MRDALAVLPPKVLALSSEHAATPVEITPSDGEHVRHAAARIEAATFIGKADKPVVIKLYKDYAMRIARVLQSTLAIAAGGGSTADGSSRHRLHPYRHQCHHLQRRRRLR